MNAKIRTTHLERRAIVYLRQSTPNQVEFHRESTDRQYALADRAHSLGWDKSQIEVLDGDLGKSGQTTTGREDFHQLMAAVGLGEVGAVLALEASRFSRSQADWHKLLDICALTDTLHYEADRAFRQYDATEPENRLVARTLEKRWNEKLQQLAELEEAYSLAHQVERLELTAEQRQQILHLANDIPALWHASSTTNLERKEILDSQSACFHELAVKPSSHRCLALSLVKKVAHQ